MFGLRVAQRGIVGSSRLLGASGRNRQWSRIPVARALSTSDTSSEEHSFQAETRQLLDIVTNSLYTDKEVFLRELISNASDSLEKLRHLQVTGAALVDPDAPLEIVVEADKEKGTLTISDAGVGLTREEMVSLLGTIARSGSKAFVAEAKAGAGGNSEADSKAVNSIIGQFGVGFYSAFMVGQKVEVASTPADPAEPSHVWASEGAGHYSIHALTYGPSTTDAAAAGAPAEGEEGTASAAAPSGSDKPGRGCRITIHLKEDQKEYLEAHRLREVIKTHSNFVNFPIRVEGEVVNTVQAIWTQSPSEVSDEDYTSFYRFMTGSYDDPTYRLHFRADSPIDLKVLLFVPSQHSEKWGGGHMQPGVSLYSRKVLIEKNSADLLPEWMRFVKGVVDSEDLPLAISREKPQDSRLLKRIQTALVKKLLKFLADRAAKEPEAYKAWFSEFGLFLKEGVCRDFENQADLAKLLYFESSSLPAGELSSLDEYVARCTPEQGTVYFLCAPNRALAEASPYYETFKAHNREVLFVYNAIDDFVMTNLGTYNKRPLKSAESADLDLDKEGKTKSEDEKNKEKEEDAKKGLSEAEVSELGNWMVATLPTKLASVKATSRLVGSPVVITDHESGALRRMMKMVEQQNTGVASMDMVPPQALELNPKHPLVKALNQARLNEDNADVAKLVLEQLVDNALVGAGLMDDSRVMVGRVNTLLEALLEAKNNSSNASTIEK